MKESYIITKTDKITRILKMYYTLIKGEYINKKTFSIEHGITERTFDRDIEDIRVFLSEIYSTSELRFDRVSNLYYLTGYHNVEITGVELMALLKILMNSRAFIKEEMEGILSEIICLVSRENQKNLIEAVKNEIDTYVGPIHKKAILKLQWDLNQCILRQRKIELIYNKQNGGQVSRKVSPISVVFSEFYFYLVAFIEGQEYNYPAFFRIDRIESFSVLDEKYSKELYEKYNVGDMKKCIQFMFAGDLIEVKLKCAKSILEPVLDRLPNGEIIETQDEFNIIKCKIFGEGFIRWILTQGNKVEILEPKELRKKIYEEAINIANLYKLERNEDDGQKN